MHIAFANFPYRTQPYVFRLLEAHQVAGQFLGGAWGTDVTRELKITSRLVGTMIGPYKLLQQIGEGGMGSVYMAEQTEPS